MILQFKFSLGLKKKATNFLIKKDENICDSRMKNDFLLGIKYKYYFK